LNQRREKNEVFVEQRLQVWKLRQNLAPQVGQVVRAVWFQLQLLEKLRGAGNVAAGQGQDEGLAWVKGYKTFYNCN